MISYAFTDKEVVFRIQQQLVDHGYNIWCDRTQHRKGKFNKNKETTDYFEENSSQF